MPELDTDCDLFPVDIPTWDHTPLFFAKINMQNDFCIKGSAKMAALVAEGARQVSDTEVRVCHIDEATAEEIIAVVLTAIAVIDDPGDDHR